MPAGFAAPSLWDSHFVSDLRRGVVDLDLKHWETAL